MQHPTTKRWHCDDCGEIYQQKAHLENHHKTCKRHLAAAAERERAAKLPPPPPGVEAKPFDEDLDKKYQAKKAANAKKPKES